MKSKEDVKFLSLKIVKYVKITILYSFQLFDFLVFYFTLVFICKWSLNWSVYLLSKILCSSSCRVKCAYVFLYVTEYFDK